MGSDTPSRGDSASDRASLLAERLDWQLNLDQQLPSGHGTLRDYLNKDDDSFSSRAIGNFLAKQPSDADYELDKQALLAGAQYFMISKGVA